ncbi:hypothetical protein M8J76_011561 [Diaphorina citri]|nr:hypothetical protein M8J76_011425 [Diaphorina citri]KAI5706080.1 hypothetical protein M8J75_004632 [Diaphorina citri]KAI5741220.1 hypothetical protein M8J76_011561 [Diaphorina citri]KAI5746409.1 hypothetical protein M8J77_003295 [Diaphorina citri]
MSKHETLFTSQHSWSSSRLTRLLKTLLKLYHLFGIISLPSYHAQSWKSKVHRFYSRCVIFLNNTGTVCVLSSTFIYSVHDEAEFVQKLFEMCMVLFLLLEINLFRASLGELLELVHHLENVSCKSHMKAVLLRKRQDGRLIYLVVYAFVIMCTALQIVPLLPKSPEELETNRRIYNLSHPNNVLPVPMYIPLVDTSEPQMYPCMYVLNMYLCVLTMFNGIASNVTFPLLVHLILLQYEVLSNYIRQIGVQHTNANGRRIYYTNIRRGDFIEHRTQGIRGCIKTHHDRQGCNEAHEKDFIRLNRLFQKQGNLYEYYYLKQVIDFNIELFRMRKKIDSYSKVNVPLHASFLAGGILLCTYQFLRPELFSARIYIKIIMEALIFSVCFLTFCHYGEVLARCNSSLNSALWNSQWYGCSTGVRKSMVMMLRRNHKFDYTPVLKGLVECNHIFMITAYKFSYSVFNIISMRFKK